MLTNVGLIFVYVCAPNALVSETARPCLYEVHCIVSESEGQSMDKQVAVTSSGRLEGNQPIMEETGRSFKGEPPGFTNDSYGWLLSRYCSDRTIHYTHMRGWRGGWIGKEVGG